MSFNKLQKITELASTYCTTLPWTVGFPLPRYDYPSPKTKRDLWSRGLVHSVAYVDGVIQAEFTKPATHVDSFYVRNHLIYLRISVKLVIGARIILGP